VRTLLRLNAAASKPLMTVLFLKVLALLWQKLLKRSVQKNVLKVGVCLSELLEAENTTRDVFSWKPQARPNANLSAATDRVHQRFG
jgi:hypothetical protein